MWKAAVSKSARLTIRALSSHGGGVGKRPSRAEIGLPSSFHRVRTGRLWMKKGPHGTLTRRHHPDPPVRRRLQSLPSLRIWPSDAADPLRLNEIASRVREGSSSRLRLLLSTPPEIRGWMCFGAAPTYGHP